MSTTTSTTFRRIDRSWVRDHHGEITSGGDQLTAHVAGPDDTSPIHMTYPTGYDSKCGWCYLGANHSEVEHARRVAAA